MNFLVQSIGALGAGGIVFAYYMVTQSKWRSNSREFLWLNLVSALLLIVSLCFNFNLGSMAIELFWVAISIRALLQRRRPGL